MRMTIEKIETDEAPEAIGPYSQAVLAGPFLFISGQIPIDPQTGQLVEDTIEAQTEQVLDNIEAILKAKGLSFHHVVKTEVFLKDMEDFQAMNSIYAKRFSNIIKPARQAFQVARLPRDARVEISCIAFEFK
ncbi:MAG TPA: RidA family protein [Rhabdochlamydiaceae bacterium]|nr:RidA family protein [Rhabdochlamydiaceae bacterium]